MVSRSISRFQLAAFSLASMLGLALGACAEEPDDCSAGSVGCECILGQCLPGLQCLANVCFPGAAGDGDGDSTGDDTSDGNDTNDTNDTSDTSDECPGGEILCDGQCADPMVDPLNCGQCGNACSGVCDAGQCEVVDCTTEACPAGSFCDLGTHECMPGCAFDQDCTEGSCDIATHTCGFGAGDECDIFAQNCVDGYKCDATLEPPICVMLPPNPKQVGESCDLEENDCAAGAQCMYLGKGSSIGECFPMCGGSADSPSCGGGEFCALTVPPLCLESCDPLGNDCNVGQGCFQLPAAMEFGCLPDGTLQLGESCGFINDCASGLGCNANTYCSEYCLVANPPLDCTCEELFDGVGLCL